MKGQDYHASITVDKTADEVFEIINTVTKWWTEDLTGSSMKPGDEFTVRFGDVHVSTQKIIEVLPAKSVVWLVTDSRLNFTENPSEWTGTKISFDISSRAGKTQIDFTHYGLAPDLECFEMCTQGWDQYLKGSLYKLLTIGKGDPGTK